MAKKSNSNRVLKKATNYETNAKSYWLEEYRDYNTLTTKPVTPDFIKRLADELGQWSLKDDSLTITSFCKLKGLRRTTVYRWIDQYPDLEAAHKFALEQFADKREIGGLTRKYDPNFAFNSLAKYDPEWREFMQWKANLKQDDGNQQKVVVEINDLSLKASSEGQ